MVLIEQLDPARLLRMAMMSVLALLAIFLEATPMGIEATSRPSPDLLLCVVAYWSIRRPGSAPAILVFALGLVRDLLTDVPVGAGALSLMAISELLKMRCRTFARSSFAMEWAALSIAAFASAAVHWFVVVLLLAQPPYLIDLFNQSVYTMMAYPVMALVFRWVLRISWKRIEAI